MKKLFTVTIALGACIFLSFGQIPVVIDFENLGLNKIDTVLDGKSDKGGRYVEDVYFASTFASWGFSNGFAFSTYSDTLNGSYTNPYSSFTGGGFAESKAFALAFGKKAFKFKEAVEFKSLEVTNSTYAGLSMKKGDNFAKKFGGTTGNDSDYFKLTMNGYLKGDLISTNSLYLADFRDADNSKDYILKEWKNFAFSRIVTIDSLNFELESSDVGLWGMNTPAYFCLDNISYTKTITSLHETSTDLDLSVFPNPVVNTIHVSKEVEAITVFSAEGSKVSSMYNTQNVDVSSLSAGVYIVETKDKGQSIFFRIIKK